MSEYDDFVSKADSLFSNFQQNQRRHETTFDRHLVYGPVQEVSIEAMPSGKAFMHGGIAGFDIDAMAQDEEFRDAIRRLIEYHVNFQIWHFKTGRSANQVLNLLDSNQS